MKHLLWLFPLLAFGQFHRAEQDREIRYWLLDPVTHQFRISHDFTVTRKGQKSVHSFVRKGSTWRRIRRCSTSIPGSRCIPTSSAARK